MPVIIMHGRTDKPTNEKGRGIGTRRRPAAAEQHRFSLKFASKVSLSLTPPFAPGAEVCNLKCGNHKTSEAHF